MPGWLKALIIIVIVVVILAAGAIAAGVYYVYRNKDAWVARAKEVATEGRDYGRKTDNQGCVDESISRYKQDPGFSNAIAVSVFMRTCLESSRATPGFCNDVPKQTEFVRSGQWRVEQCRRVGLSSDSKCPNLFTPIQQFCEQRSSQ